MKKESDAAQSPPVERVTRLKVAERQLNVAIRMFFERKDMIAVHTLAAAAQGVLGDIGRAKGFNSFFEQGLALIVPEKRDEFRRLTRKAQNDFKHADRDPNPDAEIHFYFQATEFHLFDAAYLLNLITGRLNRETLALTGYFMTKYPNFFIDDGKPELKRAKELASTFDSTNFKTILWAMDNIKLPG